MILDQNKGFHLLCFSVGYLNQVLCRCYDILESRGAGIFGGGGQFGVWEKFELGER
jgi:hypothetical protein